MLDEILKAHKLMKKNYFRHISMTILIALLPIVGLYAESQEDTNAHHNEPKEKEFNAGDMIVNHIIDSYEWHILTWKGKHISIPLPIILYDREEGKLVSFCYSKLHHGHSTYNGYKLASEGKNAESIVKVDSEGNEIKDARLPLDFSITKITLSIFISSFLLILIFTSIAKRYKKRGLKSPKGLQSVLEPIILFIRDDVAIPAIGKNKYHLRIKYILGKLLRKTM